MFEEKTTEIVNPVSEENVASMLPVIGLNGGPVVKSTPDKSVHDEIDDKVDDLENDDNILKLSEAVINYITDPGSDYSYEVEEGVEDAVINYETDVEISRKTRKLVIKISLLKAKIKNAKNCGIDKKKVIDLKRELVQLMKEFSAITKTSSKESKKEIKKLFKFAEAEAGKEIKDSCKEKDDEKEKDDNDNETIEESVLILTEEADDDDDKKKLPPELKRLDEKRGRLENLKDDLRKAKEKLQKTGEKLYENKIKGLTAKIEKLEKEIESDEKKVEKLNEKNSTNESTDDIITEAANMEEEIKPIVEKLERKGYGVKYASPGHKKLRKKEDGEPDGVYYKKLYSDARIMFDKKYSFPTDAPKYWHWREVDGCSYLDITPLTYKEKDGTPNEAFDKWKENYMNSLRKFVDDLSENGKEVKESLNTFAESFIEDMYYKMGLDEIVIESANNEDDNVIEESTNYFDKVLDEFDELLS